MKNELKERVDLLRSQIHALLDSFYEETGWTPHVDIEVATVMVNENSGSEVFASNVEVSLK
jgi:hypothetical protein